MRPNLINRVIISKNKPSYTRHIQLPQKPRKAWAHGMREENSTNFLQDVLKRCILGKCLYSAEFFFPYNTPECLLSECIPIHPTHLLQFGGARYWKIHQKSCVSYGSPQSVPLPVEDALHVSQRWLQGTAERQRLCNKTLLRATQEPVSNSDVLSTEENHPKIHIPVLSIQRPHLHCLASDISHLNGT